MYDRWLPGFLAGSIYWEFMQIAGSWPLKGRKTLTIFPEDQFEKDASTTFPTFKLQVKTFCAKNKIRLTQLPPKFPILRAFECRLDNRHRRRSFRGKHFWRMTAIMHFLISNYVKIFWKINKRDVLTPSQPLYSRFFNVKWKLTVGGINNTSSKKIGQPKTRQLAYTSGIIHLYTFDSFLVTQCKKIQYFILRPRKAKQA